MAAAANAYDLADRLLNDERLARLALETMPAAGATVADLARPMRDEMPSWRTNGHFPAHTRATDWAPRAAPEDLPRLMLMTALWRLTHDGAALCGWEHRIDGDDLPSSCDSDCLLPLAASACPRWEPLRRALDLPRREGCTLDIAHGVDARLWTHVLGDARPLTHAAVNSSRPVAHAHLATALAVLAATQPDLEQLCIRPNLDPAAAKEAKEAKEEAVLALPRNLRRLRLRCASAAGLEACAAALDLGACPALATLRIHYGRDAAEALPRALLVLWRRARGRWPPLELVLARFLPGCAAIPPLPREPVAALRTVRLDAADLAPGFLAALLGAWAGAEAGASEGRAERGPKEAGGPGREAAGDPQPRTLDLRNGVSIEQVREIVAAAGTALPALHLSLQTFGDQAIELLRAVAQRRLLLRSLGLIELFGLEGAGRPLVDALGRLVAADPPLEALRVDVHRGQPHTRAMLRALAANTRLRSLGVPCLGDRALAELETPLRANLSLRRLDVVFLSRRDVERGRSRRLLDVARQTNAERRRLHRDWAAWRAVCAGILAAQERRVSAARRPAWPRSGRGPRRHTPEEPDSAHPASPWGLLPAACLRAVGAFLAPCAPLAVTLPKT
jgi:hypothetical protein